MQLSFYFTQNLKRSAKFSCFHSLIHHKKRPWAEEAEGPGLPLLEEVEEDEGGPLQIRPIAVIARHHHGREQEVGGEDAIPDLAHLPMTATIVVIVIVATEVALKAMNDAGQGSLGEVGAENGEGPLVDTEAPGDLAVERGNAPKVVTGGKNLVEKLGCMQQLQSGL